MRGRAQKNHLIWHSLFPLFSVVTAAEIYKQLLRQKTVLSMQEGYLDPWIFKIALQFRLFIKKNIKRVNLSEHTSQTSVLLHELDSWTSQNVLLIIWWTTQAGDLFLQCFFFLYSEKSSLDATALHVTAAASVVHLQSSWRLFFSGLLQHLFWGNAADQDCWQTHCVRHPLQPATAWSPFT